MSSNQELLNINNIYSSKGNSKKDWEYFLKDINNDSYIDKIVFFLQKNMQDQPQNELTVDLIDFIIDYGSQKIISQIAQKQFLDTFLNLLKSETKAGLENQKKVIYLTQKWCKKFNGNQNYSIFSDNYNFLKNNGIAFPPDNFVIKTYDNYVSKDEIQSFINNNQNQNNNNNYNNFQNNQNMNNYNNNSDNFYNNYNNPQNNNANNQKIPNPFENNNSSQNDGFPMQNNNSGFPMQNNNNSGFPMQNNNNDFPTQSNNDGFPRNDNNNYNFNNNNNYNNYSHSNSGPSNYNAYNVFGNTNDNNYNKYNSFSYDNSNNYSNNNSDPNTLVDVWKQKIKTYNGYIGEGKFSYHAIKLKEGIKEILDTLPIIDSHMNKCFSDNTRRNLNNIKSDMEQTCYRYECLKNDKKVEPFQSAFDGNPRKYFFDGGSLFKEKQYIPYNNVEQESPVMSGLEEFGNKIKDGALFVGGKIKDAAVSGYDFVKEKWDGRNNDN